MATDNSLNSLLQSLDGVDFTTGLETLDKILDLQGQVPTEELQDGYVTGLLTVLPRATIEGAVEIDRRLRNTPAYADAPQRALDHARALSQGVVRQGRAREALQFAKCIASIKGYGSNLELQEAFADALFEVAQLPDSQAMVMAAVIEQIPSFRDSEKIQYAYARVYCNSTSHARKLSQIKTALEKISALPLAGHSQLIKESLERAERNRERFQELRSQSQSGGSKKGYLAAAIVFLGVLGVLPFALSSNASDAEPPTVSTPVTLDTQHEELAKYIEQAGQAFASKDYDQATTYGIMSLRLAEKIGDRETQYDATEILAHSFAELSQSKQALNYYRSLPKTRLKGVAEKTVQGLETAKVADLPRRVAGALEVLQLLDSKDSAPYLIRMSEVCEKNELLEQASVAREAAGDLAKAAELAESSADFDRALKLLVELEKTDSKQGVLLARFRERAGIASLQMAEKALEAKDYAGADEKAGKAVKFFDAAGPKPELKARAQTVRAKAAFLQEQYKEALVYAQAAHELSPNKDRKSRLDAYTHKDAAIVTRDELDVDTFIFPPPEKVDGTYTYVYILNAEDRSRYGQPEGLFQAPDDDIDFRVRYTRRPEEGVRVSVRTYKGQYLSIEFDGGRKLLKPRLYKDTTGASSNHKNPGLSFSGHSSSSSVGKFVVHEIEWNGKDKVTRFAADFIIGSTRGSRKPAFGKVRYRSHYK